MKRRVFLMGAAIAPLTLRSKSLFAESLTSPPPSTRRLVFGLPTSAVGAKWAQGVLNIMNNRFNYDYSLEVLESRSTLKATETVKASEPDGRTLLQVQSSSMTLFPSTYSNLKYDPIIDFTPLAVMGEYTFTLTIGPAVPASVHDVNSYIAWIQAQPDYRDLGFALYGSQSHLIALMLAREKEVALRVQSYNNAEAMLGDLQNGTLAACITMAGTALSLTKNCRSIAVSSPQRLEVWPDVATFSEQGLKTLTMQGWYGWFAPAHLPNEIAKKLREQIIDIQTVPEYLALQKSLLLTSSFLAPSQILERMNLELNEYKNLVESYGLMKRSEM